jgi:lipopolysaccharide export system protein LptA
MRRRLLLALALVLAAAAPAAAQEQPRKCDILYSGRIDNAPDIATFHDPFAFRCEDGTELRADRGTLDRLAHELHLVGNVDYRDPTRRLTAADAVYNNEIGRLYATGNVVFVDDTQGMTIRGPELEYFKELPPSRPQAQVNAGHRPHLTLRPKPKATAPDTAPAADQEPLEIDGDRMALVGENDLSMFGNVVIVRPDMRATAGEARYNGATEGLELRENAQIKNADYTLRGEVVRARMPGGELEHVESHTHAFLQGKDLTVTAAELQMFFEAGELQRTVARGGGENVERPLAISKSFRLQADSLDALMPAQQLETVVAIGDARGESVDTTSTDTIGSALARADTTVRTDSATKAISAAPPTSRVSLLDSDWIVGDTITGFFASAPDTASQGATADSTRSDSTIVLKRILAQGSALSLYRIETEKAPEPAAGTASAKPRKGINFLSGSEIELTFADGELQVADVRGLEKGLYLDPEQALRPARPAAETSAPPGATEPTGAPAPTPAPPGGNG